MFYIHDRYCVQFLPILGGSLGRTWNLESNRFQGPSSVDPRSVDPSSVTS